MVPTGPVEPAVVNPGLHGDASLALDAAAEFTAGVAGEVGRDIERRVCNLADYVLLRPSDEDGEQPLQLVVRVGMCPPSFSELRALGR